jgi:hypothetical protein
MCQKCWGSLGFRIGRILEAATHESEPSNAAAAQGGPAKLKPPETETGESPQVRKPAFRT